MKKTIEVTKEDSEKIHRILDTWFVEAEGLINPNIKIDGEGRNFIPDKRVKGLVAFGSAYAFSGKDMDIQEHIRMGEILDTANVHEVFMKRNILKRTEYIEVRSLLGDNADIDPNELF